MAGFYPASAAAGAGNAASLRGQCAGVCVSAAIRRPRPEAAMSRNEIGSRGLPLNAPDGPADVDERAERVSDWGKDQHVIG